MATSQKNSHTRPWSWSQHHHVDFDDRLKCCVAWTWNSYWITLTDCKHGCIGVDELDGGPRAHLIAACGGVSLCCSLERDCCVDCNSSTVDYDTNLVCFHIVACSSNTSIMEVETRQDSWVCSVHGNDCTECCMFACVGSVFHFVEESGTYRHNYNCIALNTFSCISRDNKLCDSQKITNIDINHYFFISQE